MMTSCHITIGLLEFPAIWITCNINKQIAEGTKQSVVHVQQGPVLYQPHWRLIRLAFNTLLLTYRALDWVRHSSQIYVPTSL